MKKKILVTGATGMLGRHIFKEFNKSTKYEVLTVSKSKVLNNVNHHLIDITNISLFDEFLETHKPEIVLHCAANVSLENCEIDKIKTDLLHIASTKLLSKKSFINKLIFISSDSVFDGLVGNYKENDDTNPLNYYAKTKVEAEIEVLNTTNIGIVVRTNMIGFSKPMNNSFFEWAWKSISNSTSISGFTDTVFNPLYVKTIAKSVVELLELPIYTNEVYHLGAHDSISKYDLLLLIAKFMDKPNAEILPKQLKMLSSKILRPLNTTLDVTKLSIKLQTKFPSVEQEVCKIFKDINKNL